MYFYGHCGLAPKKCLLEFLSENSVGRESAASQRIEHTGSSFLLMLRGKSSCVVPASVIGRLKVTGIPDARVVHMVPGASVTIAQHTEGRGESGNVMLDLSVSGLTNLVDWSCRRYGRWSVFLISR